MNEGLVWNFSNKLRSGTGHRRRSQTVRKKGGGIGFVVKKDDRLRRGRCIKMFADNGFRPGKGGKREMADRTGTTVVMRVGILRRGMLLFEDVDRPRGHRQYQQGRQQPCHSCPLFSVFHGVKIIFFCIISWLLCEDGVKNNLSCSVDF